LDNARGYLKDKPEFPAHLDRAAKKDAKKNMPMGSLTSQNRGEGWKGEERAFTDLGRAG
jgi:hypothetical protein